MSAFDPNNPETWTIPRNYSGSSCFIDSALWGLLYKIDNPFYQYILSTIFNVDTNSYKLKNFLLAFYGGIHSNKKFSRDELRDIIGLIRNLFGEQFPTKQQLIDSGKSGTGHHDTTDFFLVMKQIFEKNSSSPKLTITNNTTFNVINTTTKATVPYNPTSTDTNGDIISTDNISSLDFNETTIKIDQNKLIVEYPMDNFNQVVTEDVKDQNGNKTGTIETENSFTSKQVTVTYEYKNKQAIDYLIIPISRVDHTNTNVQWKDPTKIDILEEIGDLHIHSIVVHIGGGPDSGHYVCYFKMRNNDIDEWYSFDDLVEKVEKIVANNFNELTLSKPNIQESCAFLFYTTNTNGGANVVNQDEFEKYYTFVNDSKEEYQKNKNKASLTTSSAPSSTLPKGQTTTPKKTVQTVDKCEKYGEEWLNLFIAENAVPGAPVKIVTNKDGKIMATYVDSNTGIETSVVAADENCTFVQSNGLTKSAAASVPSISEKADQALEDAKKLQIANSVVSNRVTNAEKGKDTDITPYNQGDIPDKDNLTNNLIYFNNFVYVVGYLQLEPNVIKLYKVEDNTVCDLDGTNCNPYDDNSNKFTLFDPPSTASSNSGSDPLIGQFYVNNDNTRVIKIENQNITYVKKNKITTYATEDEAKVVQAANKKIKDESKANTAAKTAAEAQAKAEEAAQAQTDANAALVSEKQNYSGNQEIIDKLKTINEIDPQYIFKKGSTTNLTKLPLGTVVYNKDNKHLYMVVSMESEKTDKSIKKDNKFFDLNDKLLCGSNFAPVNAIQNNKYTLTGGTRRKRNRNINGGKRTRKGKGKRHLTKTHKLRKGRRTRKHIRDKNRLNTNKLNTNKLRTRKLKLNKRKTRKAL